MKLAFAILLLLNVFHAKGQQGAGEFRNILLRLAFPSVYNTYTKSCCKLYPGGCYLLLDTNGYTCEFLKGRVTKTQSDGSIEFWISNVQYNDQGFYRCTVMGTAIYIDYYVEVTESSSHYTRLTLQTTTKYQSSPTTVLEPTAAVLGQDSSDFLGYPWSFPLPAIVSIAAVICFSSLVALVFCCVKAKQKQSNKKQAESPQTDTGSAIEAIVYTTVDFRVYQKPSEIYENLRVHKIQEGLQASEYVEYSTLAVH